MCPIHRHTIGYDISVQVQVAANFMHVVLQQLYCNKLKMLTKELNCLESDSPTTVNDSVSIYMEMDIVLNNSCLRAAANNESTIVFQRSAL